MKLTFDRFIIKAMTTATTTETPMEHTGLEKGLIKGLSKRNSELHFAQQSLKKAKQEALNMIWDLSPNERDKYFNILTYLEKNGVMEQAYLPTKIGEYVNKKGVKSMAHFNQNDKYIGSVKARGEEPFYVLTWTRVLTVFEEELWTIQKNEQGNVYLKAIKYE